MDVKCPNCDSSRLAAQAQVYADVLGACLENSNCRSFEVVRLRGRNYHACARRRPHIPFFTCLLQL